MHLLQVDSIAICGTDHKGNAVYLRITRKQHSVTEVWLYVQLDDGSVYQLPGKSRKCGCAAKCGSFSSVIRSLKLIKTNIKFKLPPGIKFSEVSYINWCFWSEC